EHAVAGGGWLRRAAITPKPCARNMALRAQHSTKEPDGEGTWAPLNPDSSIVYGLIARLRGDVRLSSSSISESDRYRHYHNSLAMTNYGDLETRNQSTWDRVARDYLQKHLHPPERALLERWRGRWQEVDMLDLGVGTGRTTYTFGAITRRYVGVDYSPKMIELCRCQFPEGPSVKFIVGDASDLSFLGEDRFDFILFSFNGIDYVTQDKRLRVLSEVRARLRGRDSLFLFSSHSLHSYPFAFRWRAERRRPVRTLYWLGQDAAFNLRRTFSNISISSQEA